MLGAIFGDIVGSVYEFGNTKDYNFRLLSHGSRPTDDTCMTLAVAKALMASWGQDDDAVRAAVVKNMQELGHRYPRAGYGGMFSRWLKKRDPKPYNSFGNGSAMRVSPAGWLYRTLDETLHAAKLTAEVTHNHPEGIKGAQAIAAAVFLARAGAEKEEIIHYIADTFDYNLFRSLDQIRPHYKFDVTCQGSVPEAILAFFESDGYEDAIRKAVSLGGDSDTIACMTGAIAEAFYGMPEKLKKEALGHLDSNMYKILQDFRSFYRNHSGEPLDGWQEAVRPADDPFLKYNSALEAKIDAFYEEDASGRDPDPVPVLQAIHICMLKDGHVLVPVETPDNALKVFDPSKIRKGDIVTSEEELHFNLIHLTDENGNVAMPVFTSQEKMAESGADGCSVLSVFFDEYMKQVLDMEGVIGIVLNPGTRHFILSKEVLHFLTAKADEQKFRTWKPSENARMVQPSGVPEGFPDLIREYAQNNLPEVDKIWFTGLADNNEESWCLAIQAEGMDEQGMQRIYEKIQTFLTLLNLEKPVDYMTVDGSPWNRAMLVYSKDKQ